MQRSNFPLSYPMTARSFLEKHGFLDGEEYTQKLAQEGRLDALKIDYPKKELTYAPITHKPNILIVTVSGLRHDAISSEKMPKLAEFATSSTEFTNHYSTGNSNNAGLIGLFYGLNANYTDSILSNNTQSVLIEKLRAENYQLGLFSATNFKDSLFRQALFREIKLLSNKTSKPNNESAVKNLNDFIKAQKIDSPWFAYLDLALEAKNPSDYDRTLQDIDSLLAKALESTPLENTLVIITSEHGLTFNEMSEKERENYFGRDEIQVPLLVYWKDLPVGKQNGLSSHTDILPALMRQIFHVENRLMDYTQGYNLFDLSGRDWVQASNFNWNVIIQSDGTQYHINRKGNYKKFNPNYEEQSSDRLPLGLFLETFQLENQFFEK